MFLKSHAWLALATCSTKSNGLVRQPCSHIKGRDQPILNCMDLAFHVPRSHTSWEQIRPGISSFVKRDFRADQRRGNFLKGMHGFFYFPLARCSLVSGRIHPCFFMRAERASSYRPPVNREGGRLRSFHILQQRRASRSHRDIWQVGQV